MPQRWVELYTKSHNYNKNDYVASKGCFIQYAGNTSCPEDRDIYFTFINNATQDACLRP